MKRYGNLYPQITEFANIWMAAKKAERGKRFRENVLDFNYNLEREIWQIKAELESKIYQPGPYKTFEIKEPRPRMISAAPYRDRVVHHALCNIITPIFEKSFIDDSYANRKGYGTHRALNRFTKFARSSRYILQCDIKKYFPSIDHEILKSPVRRKLKCADWLIDAIIDNSNQQEPVREDFPGDELLTPVQRRRGLPIGNLTSQFFANLYLNGFDHFVKEKLQVNKYVRYVDDFALFSDDRLFLEEIKIAIAEYLVSLRLKLHPVKSQLFETRKGANFLGFRVMPDRLRVRTENLRRGRRRLRRMEREYREGKRSYEEVSQSITSWLGHLSHGDTWRLQQKIAASLAVEKPQSPEPFLPPEPVPRRPRGNEGSGYMNEARLRGLDYVRYRCTPKCWQECFGR